MTTSWSGKVFGVDAVRDAEELALEHATEAELMAGAALAVARQANVLLRSRHGSVADSPVVILAGSGKNGGDALLAGVHLLRDGAQVTAIQCAKSLFDGAATAFTEAGGKVVDATSAKALAGAFDAVSRAQLVIDGIVGLGAKAGLRSPADELVVAIPSSATVVAVDVPSGVDVDTGETPGDHVWADVTVTFSCLKPCHVLPPAALACGRLVTAAVGVDMDPSAALAGLEQATEADVRRAWPRPMRGDHKYTRGVLGVIAGSSRYPGAAVLAVSGAIRTGVGMIRYVGPERVQNLVLATRPEVVCHSPDASLARVQAWLVGPGVVNEPASERAVDAALSSGEPLLADAGAIVPCVRHRHGTQGRRGPVVMTPHAGELAAALTEIGYATDRAEVEARPAHFAQLLARECQAVVLLKGAVTLICDEDGNMVSQVAGPPWLATAGTGDVLAGTIGALLATGASALDAAVLGAFAHSAAGKRASHGGPVAALDVANALPPVIADLLLPRA